VLVIQTGLNVLQRGAAMSVKYIALPHFISFGVSSAWLFYPHHLREMVERY
jgi:hypothetical protein